jgi:hypothetical protein
VNLTGATTLRDAYLEVPVRIYLETDPVMPQIEVAQGRRFTIDMLDAHTHHFTYGENIGRPGCGVPPTSYAYRPTRPPVILDWWTPVGDPTASAVHPFSTIANWEQQEKDLEWDGLPLSWSKHHEFLKLIDLPRHSGRPFELALSSVDSATVDELVGHGWRVRDAVALSADLDVYARFIRESRGEFTVAKEQNIRLRSGWFSDRSASYLAAGRPVITQDTGFGDTLPCGRGLFAFQDMDDVLAAVEAVASDYAGHCSSAREIASEYFDAEKLLGRMLEEAGS